VNKQFKFFSPLRNETNLFFLSGFFVYTFASSLRHFWFQSSSWDLGIFDQAIYLISQGESPFSTLLGFHILGDHGALVLYPIGFLSIIFNSTYFLFFLQGIALASSIFPLEKISKFNQLNQNSVRASFLVFLMYPVIFNVSIFDFHPEVLALPLVLDIFVSLKINNINPLWKLFLKIFFILTCKITNSFIVFGLGTWLITKRSYKLGLSVLLTALLWFYFIANKLIPYFGGENSNIIRQAGKFGIERELLTYDINSLFIIIKRLLIQLFDISNLEYLLLLTLPIIYLLMHRDRLKILTNLIPFSPLLFLNLVSNISPMKDLVHQYSLFIVPFLSVSVIETLGSSNSALIQYPIWFQSKAPKFIMLWSIFTFLIFSRFTFFFGHFHTHFDSFRSRKEAISMIRPSSSILTTNDLVPHLSRRNSIRFTDSISITNFNDFDEILLDLKKPGWKSTLNYVDNIYSKLNSSNLWNKRYEKDGIVLFSSKD
tara:strand:- start:6 stop:1460 length:1455 start_codon:yes stop_codon:yes gene_type:complete